MKSLIVYVFASGALLMAACSSGYTLVSVEGGRVPVTDVYDLHPDKSALQILQPYRHRIDSMMTPVIGHSAAKLEAYRPESPLSNLIADILRASAEPKTGLKADVGVMNIGGIRSILSEGAVTVGSIYEISPFQNTLAVVSMKGEVLLELFAQMASVHGEGLSGARLEISKEGELLHATVGGKSVDPQRDYRVATIDYLAEGNDHLEAFRKADAKTLPKNAVLRDLFIDYVKQCEVRGQSVNARTEGRIIER